MIIAVRNVRRMDTSLGPLLGSAVCGLSLFVEKKSRRLDLAMYVLPRALETAIFAFPLTARLWERWSPGVFCAGNENRLHGKTSHNVR